MSLTTICYLQDNAPGNGLFRFLKMVEGEDFLKYRKVCTTMIPRSFPEGAKPTWASSFNRFNAIYLSGA